MLALCVDDEKILLNVLCDAVKKSPDITDVVSFTEGTLAIEWAKSNRFDIAFLDIELADMNGIDLSKQLREINPHVPIYFCTAYPQYSLDALLAHANGYILKSITTEKIQKELDYLKDSTTRSFLLKYNNDGGFFLYDKSDHPIEFPRKKAIDVLEILIDKSGAAVSIVDLCDLLFPEIGGGENESNKNHLYKLLSDIRKKLKEIEAEAVLIKDGHGYKIDMSLVEDITKNGGKNNG